MPTTLSGSLELTFKAIQQSSQAFNITYSGSPKLDYLSSFSTVPITKLYFGTYTVATTPTVVDVTALTDPFGNAVDFAVVRGLMVVNNDPTNNLTVGGGTNALFSALPVMVGQAASSNDTGSAFATNTNLTVSGTTKNISLVASAGSITVDLFLVGT